ncbi:MAG: GNAT family N-acetyltransferase [Erythrobacter sp.]
MAVMEQAFDPAYGEAWNRRQVADALAMPSTHALVLDTRGERIGEGPDSGRAAGFVLTRHAADEEELLLIAVLPECRGQGFAQEMIERLFEQARGRGVTRIFLEMRRGNPAEFLYRKSGFEPIGQRPNYYRLADGGRIDAITFGRSI